MSTASTEGIGRGALGQRRRLIEVDRVTGFAILLVVVGHIVAREPPTDNEWYVSLKFYIYQFHMPLFMFMSGLIFQYTSTSISTIAEYGKWARRKIYRLAPGFLVVGCAIVAGKSLFRNVIHVDNAQGDFLESFVRLFLEPTESAAASLWYIYVLLEFYLLFPLLRKSLPKQRLLILALVIGMHLAFLVSDLPRFLALHAIFEFALYFWLGALACANYDRLLDFLRRRGAVFVFLFAASFATTGYLPWMQSKTLIGLASIPAVTYLIGIRFARTGRMFEFISGYTFVIYLLNTIAIGVTKGILLKILPWDGPNFYLYFVVLATAGMVVPILAHRWIFSRNKTLSRIMN